MRILVGAALALAAAAPCFAQGLFDDNEARRRVEALRQQVVENQRLLDERITKMEGALAGATDRSAVLQLSSQIEALRGDIARMRGQLEIATNQIETAEKRQKDLYLDIDTRIRKLEEAREQAAAAAAAAAAQPPAQPSPPGQAGESQQAGE